MRAASFPHRVTIRRNYIEARDERNNVIRSAGTTLTNVPARVDARLEGEDTSNRDQTREVFDIELPHTWRGITLDLDAADELDYGDKTLRLEGGAALQSGTSGRPGHWELTASRTVG